MKCSYNDIEKAFSIQVTEYLNKGWKINTSTMSGTQGEIASVHLISPDNSIIRIVVISSDWDYTFNHIVELSVLEFENIDNRYSKRYSDLRSLWYRNGKVIFKKCIYCLSDIVPDNSKDAWEDDLEEAKKKVSIKETRLDMKYNHSSPSLNLEKFGPIALRIVRRKPGCKRVRLNDIESVIHEDNKYRITFKTKRGVDFAYV